MNKINNKKVLYLTQGGLIAAIYVVLTLLFQPLAFGEVQIRFAEILTILPIFTPAAIPGLFIGCLIGNIFGGALFADIIFGSLATLIAAILTYYLGKKSFVFAVLPPIVANGIVVPLVLRYAYGVNLPLWFMALTVAAGEFVAVAILGGIFYGVLRRYEYQIFKRYN